MTISTEFWNKFNTTEKGLILINFRINNELEESKWNTILGRYRHLKPSQVYSTLFNEIFDDKYFDLIIVFENLKSLKRIYLDHSKIDNFEFLKQLIYVEKISAVNTKILTLNGLENLKYLHYLNISFTQIKNINILSKNIILKRLIFRNCEIKDISVVRELNQLYELSFSNTQVDDLNHLQNHPTLSVIYAENILLNNLHSLLSFKWKYLNITDYKNSTEEINAFARLKKGGYLEV